jgi:hypothetical protein
MGFSFFGKKQSEIKLQNVVWASCGGKWKACAKRVNTTPATKCVAWFEDTRKQLQEYLDDAGVATHVLLAREAGSLQLHGAPILLVEHHPMRSKEEEFVQKMGLKEATIYYSLDEAFFKRFGGDKVVHLMQAMGMNDNESIQHSMVTKAIENAQEKIENKMIVEQSARSQQEWMDRNIAS